MSFTLNKTPVEIIIECAFGGTYFTDIYSGVNGKWYRNSWKEFDFLKDIDPKLYSSNYYDVKVNKYGVKCGTSSRFWENKGGINEQDPYGWFQWYCRYYYGSRISSDANKVNAVNRANEMNEVNAVNRGNKMSEVSEDERQIKRWLGIVNRFKGILVKMIKVKGAKFDDFSVSPKIRLILLHWGYELVESECQ